MSRKYKRPATGYDGGQAMRHNVAPPSQRALTTPLTPRPQAPIMLHNIATAPLGGRQGEWMMNHQSDFGYSNSADPINHFAVKVVPGLHFRTSTAECVTAPAQPYEWRVYRAHRDSGYWECVCMSGGHPARHSGIDVFSTSEILGHVRHA